MIQDLDFENRADRQLHLEAFEEQIQTDGYPVCDPELVYSTLDAMFVRDWAANTGYESYSKNLQELTGTVLEPVRSEKESLEAVSREEASVLATTPFFRESISNFTEIGNEPVHGGELANQFIEARELITARSALHEFQDWYEEDLERMLSRESDGVSLGDYHFEREEFYDIALYNGLRMLLDRREEGERFTTREVQMP